MPNYLYLVKIQGYSSLIILVIIYCSINVSIYKYQMKMINLLYMVAYPIMPSY